MLASALAACAAGRHADYGLSVEAVPETLRPLAELARAGAKHAQLELGIRYEEGLGVPVDPGAAERLYEGAARSDGGQAWIYSPGVGNARGQLLHVNTGPFRPGLPEAIDRLAKIRNRR